ncbi:hypothetical protein GC173_08065 [bacterium]|nr:hypothetical protein [bacterium]
MLISRSLLQLEAYFFPEVSFTSSPRHSRALSEIRPTIDQMAFKTAVHQIDGKWQLNLRLEVASTEQIPVAISLAVVGLFSANVDSEKAERIVRVNGFSLLYSHSREFIRNLTTRGPYGPVHLPTISFDWQADSQDPAVWLPKTIEAPTEQST